MQTQTNVFIVDDHQMVVDGLKALLSNENRYQIVGSTTNPHYVLSALKNLDVDILLTDINMPEVSGVELTKKVKILYPNIKILALSMFGDAQTVKEMIENGISGYILKNTGKQELLNALDAIIGGGSYFSNEVTVELMKSLRTDTETAALTSREMEIIRLIEKERSNKMIAEELFISERTVETHRKNIFRKTKTQNVVGLLKYAYEHKLI